MGSDRDDTLLKGKDPIPVEGPPKLAVGQVFADRYQVQALIGRGGMGDVYRVQDRALDEVVALKLMTLSRPEAGEAFVREVRLARRVTHRNVARTYDFGDHGGARFLTMEYVCGKPLDQVVADDAPIPPARAAAYARDIAKGLAAAHAAGVVHRDLKPANVIVGVDGRLVITDFGIARAIGREGAVAATGPIIGTPRYMSPEQVSGGEVDHRCDIYALGVILFELVTGRAPFPDDNAIAAAVARLEGPPPDPRSLLPMPDELADLILRCLATDPLARPRSADDVAVALAALEPGAHRIASSEAATVNPSLPFAPIALGRHTLAVLPFLYRGPADADYLGEALGQELVDLLSRTRGLRVLAFGATLRFGDDRDPRRVRDELGADAVVDGTIQVAGGQVRISTRLLDTESGVQRWSERFDGPFSDVFELQESLGRRVAESLRVELVAGAHRRTAPQEAIELYLRARRELRGDLPNRAEDTLGLLDRCLELAPGFLPALPLHAIAAIRAWFTPGENAGDASARRERARASVARASSSAPDLAETHMASAMYSVQEGGFHEAVWALARALEIAPTMADAHQYLGVLQVEAGNLEEGRHRIDLALELDPSLAHCLLAKARLSALEGDFERAHADLARIRRSALTDDFVVILSQLRYALWAADRRQIEEHLSQLRAVHVVVADAMAMLYGVALSRSTAEESQAVVKAWARRGSPRFASLVHQLGVEAFAAAGAFEPALESLAAAASGVLIDVAWLEACPLLEPIRATEEYARSLAQVRQRSAEIWRR